MERFTTKARRVLSFAHQEAERAHNHTIGPEHLLLGLMGEEGGVAGRVLRELGMTEERLRDVTHRVTSASPHFDPNRVELGLQTQQVLENAVDEARRLGHHYIGTEHILLGLMLVESTATEVLRRLGVTAEQIRRQTRRVLNETATASSKTSSDKVFKKFNQIFIFHGQSEQKKMVAALVQKLGLVPVLLDDNSESETIIASLDKYSKEIPLAIFILTHDDPDVMQSGLSKSDWRVDRNFIYELGCFRGKLGRNRTCVLYLDDFQDKVESLAEFMDVIFIPLDSGGVWMTQLAKAMQDTGLETNLRNKL